MKTLEHDAPSHSDISLAVDGTESQPSPSGTSATDLIDAHDVRASDSADVPESIAWDPTIQIIQVSSRRELKEFIDFPHDLYKGDPHYVPELYIQQKALLDKKSHPFFEHSEAEYFLARRAGGTVGRIAAVKNNNHLQLSGDNTGHFGFFDCINDPAVAHRLMGVAREWLAGHGLTHIGGPYNFSTNESCGTLIEGFEDSPSVLTTYNKPYYADLMESCGLTKDMDLLSYFINEKDVPPKLQRVIPKIYERLQRNGITVRNVNLKKFDEEVESIKHIYNSAWEDNWGFVPMTDNEFLHLAKELKPIVDEDLMLVAEKDGVPIGFSVTIPDFNHTLRHVKRGRLLPFGIFKLLFGRKHIRRLRVITLGVVEEYRRLGIDSFFYLKAFEQCRLKKMVGGEASWILENNAPMNNALEKINGRIYKRHRLYRGKI